MRQKNILVLLILVLLLASSPALPSSAQPEVAAAVDQVSLTWTGDPLTTQTITWRTTATTTAGQVQIVEAEGGTFTQDAKLAAATMELISTNLGEMSIHSANLTGLQPGTRYLYRIGSASGWSNTRSFTTAAASAAEYKFLIFGDSQSIDGYVNWRTTVHQAYQANPDAAFFVNVGDLVDTGENQSEWNAWFSAVQDVIDTIPAMPVPGNHETYTPQGKSVMPTLYVAQLKLPANGPEALRGLVYSFDYGDVHFAVLDSQVGEEGPFIPGFLEMQSEWLDKDLAATDKLWKIVLMHRPPQNKSGGGNSSLYQAFVPIIDRYDVDLVLAGHDHVYCRTYPLQDGKVTGDPTDGTIYAKTGRSGTKTWRGAPSDDRNEFFYNPADEANYMTAEVKGDTLTLKAFKQSGVMFDTWTMTKGSPAGQR